MNTTTQTTTLAPPTPGSNNRAGSTIHSHSYPLSSAVTPTTHASASSSFQEDEQHSFGSSSNDHNLHNRSNVGGGKVHHHQPSMPMIRDENNSHYHHSSYPPDHVNSHSSVDPNHYYRNDSYNQQSYYRSDHVNNGPELGGGGRGNGAEPPPSSEWNSYSSRHYQHTSQSSYQDRPQERDNRTWKGNSSGHGHDRYDSNSKRSIDEGAPPHPSQNGSYYYDDPGQPQYHDRPSNSNRSSGNGPSLFREHHHPHQPPISQDQERPERYPSPYRGGHGQNGRGPPPGAPSNSDQYINERPLARASDQIFRSSPHDAHIHRNDHRYGTEETNSYPGPPHNSSREDYRYHASNEHLHHRHVDYDNHNVGPHYNKPMPNYHPNNTPYDDIPPPYTSHERNDHGPHYEYTQDEVVHMVSPHRRNLMPPNNSSGHHRQFSSGSESLPAPYEYQQPPPNYPPANAHAPPSHSHSHSSQHQPHPYPYMPNTYNHPPHSPMRRPYAPPPPPHTYGHHNQYHHGYPHRPIPIVLTNTNSFESSNRSRPNTPPPVPQAIHPTCQSIAEVNSDDVLCGRGGGTNSQIGNRRFRKLVHDYQPEYLVARRKAKPQISKTIVQIVRRRGGRFLKKDEATGYLFEVGDERAEAKTSQALREGLDVRASSSTNANGTKKKEDEECGRETPIVKNSEQVTSDEDRKRKRDEEHNENNAGDNYKEDNKAGATKEGEGWQEFAPPKSKAKLDDEEVKEEDSFVKNNNGDEKPLDTLDLGKTEQAKDNERNQSFPEHWSATAV